VRVAKAIDISRYIGGDQLRVLDSIAYSGCYDCETLDSIAASILSRPIWSKGLAYYTASLYLQLGETDKASDLLRKTGRASREMKWFSMLMHHCLDNGLACPRLGSTDRQCLSYLAEKYSGIAFKNPTVRGSLPSGLFELFSASSSFAVLGNAPSVVKDAESKFSLPADCVSICFNNYRLNPRIVADADIHVVTPSWRSSDPSTARHLIITGNSIFYRRSKVWRRFAGRPNYTGIHTVPVHLWCALVQQLDASPSAGLLLLCYLNSCFNIGGKVGLIAGFSDEVPQQNHSYDHEPVSSAHNWSAEVRLRKTILEQIAKKAESLQVTP